jgi:hypothetical protein
MSLSFQNVRDIAYGLEIDRFGTTLVLLEVLFISFIGGVFFDSTLFNREVAGGWWIGFAVTLIGVGALLVLTEFFRVVFSFAASIYSAMFAYLISATFVGKGTYIYYAEEGENILGKVFAMDEIILTYHAAPWVIGLFVAVIVLMLNLAATDDL